MIDFDFERGTLRIQPEKGSNPRILPISEKLTGMLNNLPKNSEYIFNPNTKALRTAFSKQRRKSRLKTQQPKITKNNISYAPPLERNNGIPQNERPMARQKSVRAQIASKHRGLHKH